MSQYSFNAREVEPDSGIGDPIPEAWYNLVILKAPEFGPNSKQNGTAISTEITVADGVYKGRKIFHNFNVDNPSEKATQIGKAQLSALSYALNVMQWTATEQLMNIVFIGKVGIEPAQNGYQAKNKISAFKHINDPSAGKVGTVAPIQQNRPAPPPAAAVPPPAQAWTPQAAPQPAYAPPPQAAPSPNLAAPPPAWTPPPTPQAWEQPVAPPVQPPAWTPPPQAPAPQPAYAPPPQPAYAPPPPAAPAPQAPPQQFAQPQAPVGDAPPWAQPQQ